MNKTCNVTNKSGGHVVYKVPEKSIRRDFNARETKRNIPVEELEMLAAQQGGRELIYNYLMIDDEEILRYVINAEPAPEYFIKEADLPNWMNTCSLAEFQDALDFAPEGTKDLIKKYAVDLKLNDYAKRQALKEQLHFDVSKALEMIEEDKKEEVKPLQRRTAVKANEDNKPVRRVAVAQSENKE